MSEKAQVLAYDREKRVYKDAYVDNFRKVRYFPSLATIGAGKADGESIILVQESPREPPPLSSTSDPTTQSATTRRLRSNLEDVPSRLMPLDSVKQKPVPLTHRVQLCLFVWRFHQSDLLRVERRDLAGVCATVCASHRCCYLPVLLQRAHNGVVVCLCVGLWGCMAICTVRHWTA